MTNVCNTADLIDSRDVIARIEELESSFQDTQTDAAENPEAVKETMEDGTEIYTSVDFGEDEYEELRTLKELADEGESNSSDWRHGETLIRDGYFTEYARQLCEDIGDIPRNLPHYIAIDWEKTADNLKVDYAEIEFDGETYFIRSC